MKKLGMLIVQDQVWGRVTANRSSGKSTRYYMDEMHLLLKEEQTAAYSVEIWKRFRKWGGIPTGLTQNVKDLLSSREVENIFENSDMIIMLNQAAGDRQILAKQLNISPHQLSYRRLCGKSYNRDYLGYLCVDEIGNIIRPNYVSEQFPKLLEKNGLRPIRFHDLRHSCASLLLANGVPMKQIQEWLGHSDFSTTANIYAHLDYASKLSSAQAMLEGLGYGNASA